MNYFADIDKRPYSVMDLLEKTTRGVFGPRFWEFFAPVLVYGLIVGPLYYWQIRKQFDELMEMTEFQTAGNEAVYPGGLGSQLEGGLVNLISFIAIAIVTQYVLLRMKHFVFAEEMPWRSTLHESMDPLRVVSFLLTGLVACILIWVGSLLCLLPGMALLIIFTLLPACLTFQPERFSFPLTEPFALLRDRFMVTVTALAVPKMIYLVVSMFIGFLIFMNMDTSFMEETYPPDPEALLQFCMDIYQKPGLVFLQIVSAVITGLFLLVLGFLTVLMYFNYTMTGDDTIIDQADEDNFRDE